MMPYQQLHFAPGSRFGYSNPGYIYLARIIEQLSGDPWEVYVQKNIFSPLGLSRSYFGVTPYHLAEDRSHNYSVVFGTPSSQIKDNGADFDPGITTPNSGWNGPLSDLAAFAAFLTGSTRGDAGRERSYAAVLARSSLEEMWHPVHPAGGTEAAPEEIGLGFFIRSSGKRTIIGHTGSQAGFRAFFWVNPGNATAVIAVVNTDDRLSGENPIGPLQPAALELLE
jgi:CubicO group peptidase (beta-lactamase class C family)